MALELLRGKVEEGGFGGWGKRDRQSIPLAFLSSLNSQQTDSSVEYTIVVSCVWSCYTLKMLAMDKTSTELYGDGR